MSFPPAGLCLGPDAAHRPTSRSSKIGGRKYVLFEAAQAGCVACVRALVEEEGLDPAAASDNAHFSVLSWAEWGGRSSPAGCGAVAEYIRGKLAAGAAGADAGRSPPALPAR